MDTSFLPPFQGAHGLPELIENSQYDQAGHFEGALDLPEPIENSQYDHAGYFEALSSQHDSFDPILAPEAWTLPRHGTSSSHDFMNGARVFHPQEGSSQCAPASRNCEAPNYVHCSGQDQVYDPRTNCSQQGSFDGILRLGNQDPPAHDNPLLHNWDAGFLEEAHAVPEIQGSPRLVGNFYSPYIENPGLYDPQQGFNEVSRALEVQDPQSHLHKYINTNKDGLSNSGPQQGSIENLISGPEAPGPSNYFDTFGSHNQSKQNAGGSEQEQLDEPQIEDSEPDDELDHGANGLGQGNTSAQGVEEGTYICKAIGDVLEDSKGNAVSWRPTGIHEFMNWSPATYLTPEVRREIMQEMSCLGSYKYARPIGPGRENDTSFHPGQKNWGASRKARPNILYVYNKPNMSTMSEHEQIPLLKHDGKVVIERDSGKPLRDYPNVPKCLSSETEGWLLEAMSRQDPRINNEDFRERMPYWHRPSHKSISMRRSRFRWKAGCKSWIVRSATDGIHQYLDALVPKHFQASNFTRGWRDLYNYEVADLHAISEGKFPNRARKVNRAKRAEKASTVAIPNGEITGADKGKDTQNQIEEAAISPDQEEGIAHPSIDFRDKVPANNVEKRVIQRALAATRESITRVLGELTPPTDESTSYNAQWDALVNHYVSSRAFAGSEPPPVSRVQVPWINAFPKDFYYDYFDLPETYGDQI